LRSAHALILTGVRRAGKSVLQAQIQRSQRGTFYCNLEDTRLYGLTPEDFPTFLSILDEVVPREAVVFLDEVQEIAEWQRLVRTLLDRERTVCVTGSNASLLGRELGTLLTGRHLSFEVFPFSYPEYVAASGRPADSSSLASYLDDGGFPAFVRERDPRILRELVRDIVQRDIAVRHRLRETRHVMNLALFLMGNTGQPLSFQTLTKALGIPSVAQTSRYVEYLQDAYLLFAVPRFSTSFKQRVIAPQKYYSVDNGLRRAVSPQAAPDTGHRLENAVYLALRGRGEPVHYACEKDSWECDFVTDGEAIQVCAELTPFNREREVCGLIRAMALPGRRRPLILTIDQRDDLAEGDLWVPVRPAWEWLASM
jgi:predicted AAA+ superfamily ATPase